MRRAVIGFLVLGLAAVGTAGLASGALKTKRAEVVVGPNGTESVAAKCKQGTRAVSGGFASPDFDIDFVGPSLVQPQSSFRSSKRKWTSTATNYVSAPGSGTLISFAYCSDELPKLKAKSESTTTLENGELRTLTARCPKGGEAIAGGFDAPGTESNHVQVFESRRQGKRAWTVTGEGTSGVEGRLAAFAYCAKRKLGLRPESESTSTDQDSVEVRAKARCGRGEQAVSGGFELDGDDGKYVTVLQSKRAGKRGWTAAGANYSGTLPVTWNVFAYCLEKEKKG